MARDPYRSSVGDAGYGGARGPQRWDTDRFTSERDRNRFGERDRFDERDTRMVRSGRDDEVFDRRGSGPARGYEEDRYRERIIDYEEPYMVREPIHRARGESITIEREREREYLSPSPPRRAPARPNFLRRQSSLDTFDRRPYREEYGPPARRADYRPAPFEPVPLPRSRALLPPRRYERDFEEIKIAEPDFYGDEEYRAYPERIRERELIRTRRRSRSRESRIRESVRSSSVSSSSSSGVETVKNEFPKRGKTRMPARLVSKRAIIELGYPFEEEGTVIIIQKALGRDNIDEVIKLSEEYKIDKVSRSSEVVEEKRTEEVTTTNNPQTIDVSPPEEVISKTTVERTEVVPAPGHGHVRSRSVGPMRTEYTERSTTIPVGPLVLLPNHGNSERSIKAEIKALEAEKQALRAERRAERELRRADRLRREGRGEGELVLYEKEGVVRKEEYVVEERESGGVPVSVQKDRKGRDPRAIRAMLKTLT